MATTFTIKQNDTYPPLEAQLSDNVGPLNLTGATVKLLLKTKATTPVSRSGTCTLSDAVAGRVRYDWVVADTSSATTYDGEFEITWASGKITTVPNSGYFTIVVSPDLG